MRTCNRGFSLECCKFERESHSFVEEVGGWTRVSGKKSLKYRWLISGRKFDGFREINSVKILPES